MFCNCIPADDDDEEEEELDEIFGGKWVEFFFPLLSTAKKERKKDLSRTHRSPRDLNFQFFLMDLCKRGIMKLLAKRGAQGSKSLISSA
jgi:hypothetical protein